MEMWKKSRETAKLVCKRGRPKKVGSQVMVVEEEEDNDTLIANAIDEPPLRDGEDDVPLAAAFSLKKKRGRPKKVAVPVTLVEEEQIAPMNSDVVDELPLKHEIASAKKMAESEVSPRIPVLEGENAVPLTSVDVDAFPLKRKKGRPKKNAVPLTSVDVDAFPLKRKRGRPKKIASGVCVVGEKDYSPSTCNGNDELPLKHTSGRVKTMALQVRALEDEEDAPSTSNDIGMPPRKSKRGRPKKIVTQGMEVEEEEDEENAPSTSSDTDWRPLKDKRSKMIASQFSQVIRVLGEEEDALCKRGRPKKVAAEGTVVEEEEYDSSTSSDIDVRSLKKKRGRPKKSSSQFRPQVAVLEEEDAAPSTANKIEAQVLVFDGNAESHFEAVQSISALSGMDEEENLDASSIDRFTASITFLEVWKDFFYKPKKLKFAYGSTVSKEREILGELELPQFSSASLPVNSGRGDKKSTSCSSKDFVLHAGGPVWALDWCPCVHQRVDQPVKCEYLAIAAHPPESSYHKMGAIFSGRGLVQIWCILNVQMEESLLMLMPPKRGRRQANESGSQMCPIDGNSSNPKKMETLSSAVSESTGFCDVTHAVGKDFDDGNVVAEADFHKIKGDEGNMPHKNKRSRVQSEQFCRESCFLSEPAALPRLVFGLAHNGRVTWDAKWKPYSSEEPQDKCRMGYLAVLLGNGSLEVWEVPSLSTVKSIYELNHKKGADPRFIKLQPVFKCSQIKRGDHQSVPLTLEWSTAVPHDLILVGFHDGTVALWKFSVNGWTKDRRPLLCFTADNVPIRTLAWAPSERNAESSNIIVTGGHEGLRFWDIRDPYRPLRDLNRLRKVVLSMDWLCDPGCLLLAFDDGNLRILSISKSANDTPSSGKPCSGTYLQGLHEYCFSTFAIWDVHVSPLTGLVAYCVSDGCTFYFKLPRKAVEKDASRNKAPLFLCGSLTEEESTLIITTSPNIPLPMKTQLTEDKCAPKPIQTKRTDADISDSDAKKDKKGKKWSGIVVLPPKIVAMHRVRWNMNKGSERWISYGGAAGLVRCQEINNQLLKRAK